MFSSCPHIAWTLVCESFARSSLSHLSSPRIRRWHLVRVAVMEHVGPPDSEKATTTNTDFMPLIEEGSGSQKATTNMRSDFMRCITEGEVNIKSVLTRALSVPEAVISTLPSVPVLTPTGPLKRTWDLVIMVLILYSAIIVPL